MSKISQRRRGQLVQELAEDISHTLGGGLRRLRPPRRLPTVSATSRSERNEPKWYRGGFGRRLGRWKVVRAMNKNRL